MYVAEAFEELKMLFMLAPNLTHPNIVIGALLFQEPISADDSIPCLLSWKAVQTKEKYYIWEQ